LIIYITEESDFHISEHDIIVVYSSADYCINSMYEIITFLSELNDKNIVCLDIFNFKSVIKRLRVMEIPTVILMEKGKEKKRISGKVSRASLEDICMGQEI